MRYRFVTCDVFTARRFGGNQLAVLPEAQGLDTAAMQRLAAEFNYSETTFVLPPSDPANLARVRIFTPRHEMPFAGHPTVGTALVLAWLGRTPPDGSFVLEEQAGLVPVRVVGDGEGQIAEFAAPAMASHEPAVDAAAVARALGLAPEEIVAGAGLPCAASCGAPFLLVELTDRAALGRATLGTLAGLPDVAAEGVFLFTRDEALLRGGRTRPHVRTGAWHPGGSRHGQCRCGAGRIASPGALASPTAGTNGASSRESRWAAPA